MNTFREVLRDLGTSIAPESHEHSRDGWLQFDCPFCSKGWHHYRMGYNLAGKYTNCWACGGHSLIDTVMALGDIPYGEAKSLLSGIVRDRTKKVKTKGKLILPKGVGPLLKSHKSYLRKRGFTPRTIMRLWNVQGIGLASGLSWRLFIPIYKDGELVSWTTRAIKDNAKLRYRSAGAEEESFPHKELLYGEDYCRHACLVQEGPLDAWTIGPGAVATCGTGFSPEQIERIVKYPIRAICFDNEPTAQERAKELLHQLAPFPGETMNITLETGKDANEADPEEIKELRKYVFGDVYV